MCPAPAGVLARASGSRRPCYPRGLGKGSVRQLLGRVLRLRLLAADAGDAVVGGDRRLREADRDQRDLAVVACDVAGGVDAGAVGLHGRADLDLPLVLEL